MNIEDMSEEEFNALSPTEKVAAMQEILEQLCDMGMAWKGDDGRYRLLENVEMAETPSGEVFAVVKPLH